MKATVQVDNSPYGISSIGLFEEMAIEWRGWDREKSWGSLEGEFDLTETSDSTGHVTLLASVYSRTFPPCAKMICEFYIESGQLDKLNKQALEFFK